MDPLARRRFARQLLLAEIGDAGQARLCASRVKLAGGGDAQAAETARAYLERAGLQVVPDTDDAPIIAAVPSASAVRALARNDQQHTAAAALAGAFAAVEAMKDALAIGTRGAALPADLFDFEATP